MNVKELMSQLGVCNPESQITVTVVNDDSIDYDLPINGVEIAGGRLSIVTEPYLPKQRTVSWSKKNDATIVELIEYCLNCAPSNQPSNDSILILEDNNGCVTSDWLPTPPDDKTYYDVLSAILHMESHHRRKFIRDLDYIRVTDSDGETFDLVANIDTYTGFPDGEGGVIGHHIDFISKNLYQDRCPMRPWDSNRGSRALHNPFMSSGTMTQFLTTKSSRLPFTIKDHIINKRVKVPIRYKGEEDTGAIWVDLGSNSGGLWLPFYREIWGGDYGDYETASNLVQYPSLNGTADGQRLKYRNGFADGWWTASAFDGDSCYFVGVYTGGNYARYYPTTAYGIPLCFRFK